MSKGQGFYATFDNALLHVKNITMAHNMDMDTILAALGQKLIWYLPIKGGVKITFLQLRTEVAV